MPSVDSPQLVAQALRFLSTTIRIGHYKQHFSDKQMISVLVEGVVVPNIGLRGQCNAYSLKRCLR